MSAGMESASSSQNFTRGLDSIDLIQDQNIFKNIFQSKDLSNLESFNGLFDLESNDHQSMGSEISSLLIFTSKASNRTCSEKTAQHTKRLDNTINSNAVRLLKQCMKQHFGLKNQVYSSFLQFIKSYQIKSQLWAFEGILTFILFLRDQTRDLDQENFQTLKKLIIHKLNMVSSKNCNSLIKYFQINKRQRLKKYSIYCEEFFKEGNLYSSLQQMKEVREAFFDSVILNKKTTIVKCMFMLEHIQESLALENNKKNSSNLTQFNNQANLVGQKS